MSRQICHLATLFLFQCQKMTIYKGLRAVPLVGVSDSDLHRRWPPESRPECLTRVRQGGQCFRLILDAVVSIPDYHRDVGVPGELHGFWKRRPVAEPSGDVPYGDRRHKSRLRPPA